MKTNKKGVIKLQTGDYRVGNFVFHSEPKFVKVMPVSAIVSWRISTASPAGILVQTAIKEKHDNWLSAYATAVFSQLCVIPDQEFFTRHAELINAQVQNHPEHYGKTAPTDDKKTDDDILQEERELQEQLENTPEKP